MSRADKIALLALLEEKERRSRGRKLMTYFPDTGPLRRELYPKHMAFFTAGLTHPERAFIAANRVGKTESGGGYEFVMHATGRYPEWWPGRRFDRPTRQWGAGDTGKTVREIIQAKLLGAPGEHGTGLIPADAIVRTTPKHGVPDAVDTIYVKHVSGGFSQLVLKSYDQKRVSFQGTEQDVIWLDEEPPLDIYTECLLRTTDTSGLGTHVGILMLTFTPLKGMSETVMQFLPAGEITERMDGPRAVIMAGWDDVPHLTEAVKAQLLASIPAFQRDARTKGIPQLGAGAIYPVPESEFVVPDFQIPDHWPRAYGMDVGWNRTAAPWGAWDRETDTVYLYAEHYRGQAEPSIHAAGIKARGDWIPGAIDPASRGRSQEDGRKLLELYRDLGLKLEIAENGVESGIYDVWERLSTGRLKVFRSLGNWLQEFRLYRRDDKGKIVKANDHLMDATRYLIVSGLARAKVKPAEKKQAARDHFVGGSGSWMG
jgi:phage terminase large subunit-like protein